MRGLPAASAPAEEPDADDGVSAIILLVHDNLHCLCCGQGSVSALPAFLSSFPAGCQGLPATSIFAFALIVIPSVIRA